MWKMPHVLPTGYNNYVVKHFLIKKTVNVNAMQQNHTNRNTLGFIYKVYLVFKTNII